MPDAELDAIVIGGGVVGLAIAAALAPRGVSLALFERHPEFGREGSSRNSEVVHAGIYYAAGSLKERLCVEGRHELYALAERHDLPFRKCGKVIVALEETDVSLLEEFKRRGEANGVEGLRLLARGELAQLEPHVEARAALHSPETGIISAHALMDCFARLATDAGAELVRGAEVRGFERDGGVWRVAYCDAGGDEAITARVMINAAGLSAQRVMRMAGLDPATLDLRRHLCKGEYFAVHGEKRGRVRSLVYPPPEVSLAGLGIHTVPDLGGGLKLGPSAFYVDEEDYAVEAAHAPDFLETVRPFLPFLEPEDLAPDMAGIRPKLAGEGEPARDFHIAHEAAAGAPGFFNLAGIESPGLTASPAIGRLVAELATEYLA